jgi:hypothetical protein
MVQTSRVLYYRVFQYNSTGTGFLFTETVSYRWLYLIKFHATFITKLLNKELRNLYASPNITEVIISRRMRCAGYVTRTAEIRNAYKTLVGKRKGKRPIARPKRRWENKIRMDLRYGGKLWTGFIWLRIGTNVRLL